jgi:ferrous iron transport protein A
MPRRMLRHKRGIFKPKEVNHVAQDLVHVHRDIEHALTAHETNAETKAHLEEVDEHLHELMRHSVDLGAAVPLAFFPENTEGKIVGLAGGRGLTQRLAEMGFTPGTKVRVSCSQYPGPILVDIKGSRVALGRGVAMKIMMKE